MAGKEKMITFLTDLEGHYHAIPSQDERHVTSSQIKNLIKDLKEKVKEVKGKLCCQSVMENVFNSASNYSVYATKASRGFVIDYHFVVNLSE